MFFDGDFTKAKKGSLAVEETDDAYVQSVADATAKLKAAGFPIYATQDWHPATHASLDAAAAGYKVTMVKNLSKGVAPETSAKALDEMKAKGITVIEDLDIAKINGM